MHVTYKQLILIAALVFVLSFLAVTGARAQEDVAQQVLTRINDARREAEALPLERNPLLDAAAQGHANDLAQNGSQLGHRGSDGSDIRQRIARAGYPINMVGENWAGYRTLDKIMEFWLTDPPHRRNILKAKFRDIGIGVAIRPNGGLLVVTDFGGGGQALRASPNQPERAPQLAVPPTVPSKPTSLPPPTQVPPTREPTRLPTLPPPTAIPTAIPTVVPTAAPTPLAVPTQVALVRPFVATKSLALRGKVQKLRLGGTASAVYGQSPAQADMRRMLMGGTLSIGGALLFGIAMLGYRRSRMRG